jgi:hypothetical protein
MDEDFQQQLRRVLRKSRELARQSEELAGRTQQLMTQTEILLQQFRESKKDERERPRKKLGSS